CIGGPLDKESLLSKYRDRFVVVMDDGISIGIGDCDKPRASGSSVKHSDIINCLVDPPCLSIMIKGLGEVKARTTFMSECDVEALHKGEVLKVLKVSSHFGYLV